MKAILLFLVIAVILVSGCATQEIDKDTAECIASKSTLYIRAGCPYCDEQKEIFGESVEYLNIIDCMEEPAACTTEAIAVVPTWVIDGEKIVGVQSIAKLKELTGC